MNPVFRLSTLGGASPFRRDEPVTVGIPFPRAWCSSTARLKLATPGGQSVPVQARALDAWSDGSLRWVLLDWQARSSPDAVAAYELQLTSPPSAPPAPMPLTVTGARVEIDTGTARFQVTSDGVLDCVDPSFPLPVRGRFTLQDGNGKPVAIRAATIDVEETGHLRSVVRLTAALSLTARETLQLFVRYHFYRGKTFVRVQATLRNPARATHDGGFWDLGDPGSRFIKDFSFAVALPSEDATSVWCSPESAVPVRTHDAPFEIYQDSSGGKYWNSTNHLNRNREIPLQFRGYRIVDAVGSAEGLRASPLAGVRAGAHAVSVFLRDFWQRCPKALTATSDNLQLHLLPRQFQDVHELQGGEQLSEEFVVALGDDTTSEVPLDWARDPLRLEYEPEWHCAAGALPYLTPVTPDDDSRYASLVNVAIRGPHAFTAKRETIDEYGWRHFGDLYADHERVFHTGAQPLVSHYNNQYDAVAGMACQLFRSGDRRWLPLMTDLARHVLDIDIYHTTEDKAAYNLGMFWHTAHHVDADTATHRTYPKAARNASGGPSAEHNYSTGLMLYYFLTGDVRAREAVIDLARWVVAMDDGRLTPLRWLTTAPTGYASATGSFHYHGPGRGPGNGIVTLLNATRLTGDASYLAKAEELIRRCVHPCDDLPSLTLLDAERRWYYTVFLQAIGRYLDFKTERAEFDERYAYAHAVLLHYARWMVQHEYPYLEKPEILEFPNETWAAQDMRKCDVFLFAAKYGEDRERETFLERAEFFFGASVGTLSEWETRTFTRPVVLMMTNGYMWEYWRRFPATRASSPAAVADFGAPARFEPQKTVALRRLKILAAAGVLVLGAAGVVLLSLLQG